MPGSIAGKARSCEAARGPAGHTVAAPRPHPAAGGMPNRSATMSKGLDRKREDKKKPAKTAKEKKQVKRDKKAGKPFAPA